MSIWHCEAHGLYGGQTHCPVCNANGRYVKFDENMPRAIRWVPSTSPTQFLHELREVNGTRAAAWTGDAPSDALFWAVELGGEVGEILNVVKKLKREELGWPGSRATKDDLADEIADVLICLDSLARHYDIDLESAVRRKFNKTSDKVGLPHKL